MGLFQDKAEIEYPYRPLTDLELGYVNSRVRLSFLDHRLGQLFILAVGAAGAALLYYLSTESRSPEKEMVLFLMGLVMLLFAVWGIWTSFKTKAHVDKQASLVKGVLRKKKTVSRVAQPNGAPMSLTTDEYFIGNFMIMLPSPVVQSSVCEPLVDQQVELVAVGFVKAAPIVMKPHSRLGDSEAYAIVLELGSAVRIHEAIKKHGKYIFVLSDASTPFFIFFCPLIWMYLVFRYDLGGLVMILGVVFCPIVIGLLVIVLLEKFNRLSLAEKLRG